MNIDILKLIVVLAALLYFNFKARPHVSSLNYWIMNAGLCLILFASILDFTDGFESLNHIPILGKKAPFHDILEDQFLDTPGLALFLFGAFREMITKKNK